MKPGLEGKYTHDGVENISIGASDVIERRAVAPLVAMQGTCDVLINCAGFVHHESVSKCTDDKWDMAFNLSFRRLSTLHPSRHIKR